MRYFKIYFLLELLHLKNKSQYATFLHAAINIAVKLLNVMTNKIYLYLFFYIT